MLPAGLIEYYYKEVDTWHTTHPSGVEVFYFSTGQTEAHHPSGMKEIIFPGEASCSWGPSGLCTTCLRLLVHLQTRPCKRGHRGLLLQMM